MSYHQLGEHPIQLVVSRHRQRWLHGLQGKVLPKPVGDLRVVAVVETAEDEGEAATAAATTFPGSHGRPMCSAAQVGRAGGTCWASVQPPPPQGSASVREYCGQKHVLETNRPIIALAWRYNYRSRRFSGLKNRKHQHFLLTRPATDSAQG